MYKLLKRIYNYIKYLFSRDSKQTIVFEKQEESGFNSKDHYQFGSNCCIGCKRDRSLKEEGLWCQVCKNYQK